MKRMAAWILMLVLTLPLGITAWYLNWHKHTLKKSIKKELIHQTALNELELLTFKRSEINTRVSWKDAHEFSLNGNMYDIVSSQIVNDSIYYWCWPDRKETQLNAQLYHLLDTALGQNPVRSESTTKLFQYCATWYLDINLVTVLPASVFHSKIIAHYNKYLPTFYLENVTPPPQLC
jgi:hypothetical protein